MKAYRQRALAEHPDKGGDVDRFDALKKAYEVLSDQQPDRNSREAEGILSYNVKKNPNYENVTICDSLSTVYYWESYISLLTAGEDGTWDSLIEMNANYLKLHRCQSHYKWVSYKHRPGLKQPCWPKVVHAWPMALSISDGEEDGTAV